MFRSYDHLQVDVFSRIYTTDNGSVFFFRILDIIVYDYSDMFKVNGANSATLKSPSVRNHNAW
jgi:hypothetical protein